MESTYPTNNLVQPLLTDMYQISMAYAYWKGGRANDHAVFDLFFRKCPFQGEYCLFAGLDEIMKLLQSFKFSLSDIDYLKSILPSCDAAFFDYLLTMNCSTTRVYAMKEGTVVYSREPLLRIEGPLIVGQLLETTLLNLVNFPSLITTNAARMRQAAGDSKTLLEFGLRRAQGPDGAISASKYSVIGGFNGTSNVLAGKLFGMSVKGTHAHAYVMAHKSIAELHSNTIKTLTGDTVNFVDIVLEKKRFVEETLDVAGIPRESELAAYISYAQAFPAGFLALVDTFDTLRSGVPNYLTVGLALKAVGYQPVGIRLDSGDLGALSIAARGLFKRIDEAVGEVIFATTVISASDDINEQRLLDLSRAGHEIDTFGIGTNLVTCQKQPALGCVYKLVEINGEPRIKLSNDLGKSVLPGSKLVRRLLNEASHPIGDVIQSVHEEPIQAGAALNLKLLTKSGVADEVVIANSIENILILAWDGAAGVVAETPTLVERANYCKEQLQKIPEHTDPVSPIPYKVYLTPELYKIMIDLQHNA